VDIASSHLDPTRLLGSAEAVNEGPEMSAMPQPEVDVPRTGGPVGLVVGTVAATPLQFSVAISPEQYLQLDDVVVTSRELPGLKPVQVSGIVMVGL
jgi:hypothetical protein